MPRKNIRLRLGPVLCPRLGWLVLLVTVAAPASAAQIQLKDGRIITGQLGYTSGLAEKMLPLNPEGTGPLQLIAFVDDGLRRTFFSKRNIQGASLDDKAEIPEKYRLRQQVIEVGRTVKSIGAIVRVQPFDQYGRRILTIATARGPENIIQGITELTPTWTRTQSNTHVLDMRLATSSIPPDILAKILAQQTDQKDLDQRKKVVRFYLQSERYEEAYQELKRILKDFGDRPDIHQQLEPSLHRIRQLSAHQLLGELKLRRDSGQHQLVLQKLNSFPSEDVAAESLQAVREMIAEYQAVESNRTDTLAQFDALVQKIGDSAVRQRIQPFSEELHAELSFNTMARMAAFRAMLEDKAMSPEDKVALAISGWLAGSDDAVAKLPLALSAYRVRNLIAQYLGAADALARHQVFEQFHSEEAAKLPVSMQLLGRILSHMKPPVASTQPDPAKPGYFELEVPGRGDSPAVHYIVQLPPEYDPHRRYPTVLTLHGDGVTPEQQIDWWAGPWTAQGWRSGQASRFGTIVVAPEWAAEHQKKYQYSAREHAAVLDCLRDACRRFSIDTDRVFLSGHSMGGDAAWDLGLAHPDLWAGVIPIVAQSDRYCALYWENAKLVPFYFVCGELDDDKLVQNSRDLDRYVTRGYNCTVVEYEGRGHEHFSDEILRIFDWMGRLRRNFFPREFETMTMRRWDNFFWWVELSQMPERAMIDPINWPPPRGTNPVETKASVTATNGLRVMTGAGDVRIWLSPEIVDLTQRVSIIVNGHRLTGDVSTEPKLDVFLEDARTRADRQHPFWARVDAPTGRRIR